MDEPNPFDQSWTDVRRCFNCRRYKRLTEFRRRRKDGDQRMSQCRGCHNLAEQLRRAQDWPYTPQKARNRYLMPVSRLPNSAKIGTTLRRVIESGGGVLAFAAAWRRASAEPCSDHPIIGMKFFMDFIELFYESATENPEVPRPSTLPPGNPFHPKNAVLAKRRTPT